MRRKKSLVRIPIRKNHLLTRFGYHVKQNTKQRRREIRKAIKLEGPTEVGRRLNVLSIFNKRKHPNEARKFRADAHYAFRQIKK